MRLILLRGISLGWRLLAGLLVAGALLLVAARLALPLAEDYRQAITAFVSRHIPQELAVGRIETGWRGLAPRLVLHGLTLRDPASGERLLAFRRLEVVLDPWLSLRNGRLTARRVLLAGTRLDVLRDAEGRIRLRGFRPGRARLLRRVLRYLDDVSGTRLRLQDVAVNWQDARWQRNLHVRLDRLDLCLDDERLAVRGGIALRDAPEATLAFVARLDGPLERPTVVHGWLQLAGFPLAALPAPSPAGLAPRGELSGELWGDWRPGGAVHLLGELSGRALGWRGGGGPVTVADWLHTRLRARGDRHGWRLDLDHTRLRRAGADWDLGGLSLAHDRARGGWQGWLGRLDLAQATALLLDLPAAHRTPLQRWLDLRPQGVLRDLRGRWWRGADGMPRWWVAGRGERLAWLDREWLPGLSGVSGRFLAGGEGGAARLDAGGLTLHYPRLFREDIAVQRLRAGLRWWRAGAGWRGAADVTELATPDFTASGSAVVHARAGARPGLLADFQVPQVALARVRHYLPYQIMRPPLVRWLRGAFTAGRGHDLHFTWDGELSRFALRDGRARLRGGLDVRGGGLHYHPDWPDLHALRGQVRFVDAGLRVDVTGGRAGEARIGAAEGRIDSFYRPELNLSLQAGGLLTHLLHYVRHSPLARGMEDFLDQVASAGTAEVELDLQLPLSRRLRRRPHVEGTVSLAGCFLGLERHGLLFEDIAGSVLFDDRKVRSRGLHARFRGRPVRVRITTADDDTVMVRAAGRFRAGQLLPPHAHLLDALLPGESAWRAELRVPRRPPGRPEAPRAPLRLVLRSDLVGTTIDLPPPLFKAAEMPAALRLDYRFTRPARIALRLDDTLRLRAELAAPGEGGLRRAVIGLGAARPALPAEGVVITGRWPLLDVGAWVRRLSDVLTRARADAVGSRAAPAPVLRAVDVHLGRLRLGALRWARVHLTGRPARGGWRLTLDGPELAGTVALPWPWRHEATLRARLTRLTIPPAPPGEGQDGDDRPLDPRRLPALALDVDDFVWRGHHQGRVRLRSQAIPAGLRLTEVMLDADDLQVAMSGTWRMLRGGPRSEVELFATGEDVGAVLENLGLTNALGHGQGTLAGDLAWRGAPFRIDLASLHGRLEVDLRDGLLRKVDPGLGRLIGLLSVDRLPRRLALDFSDVAGEGFRYDRLAGSARIAGGVLHTDGLRIEGAAATLLLSGDTDLRRHRFDMRLELIPKVSASAPLAAGLLAGPQAGALVYLFDRLFREAGVDFNRAVSLEFAITGTWEAPRLEPLQAAPEPEPPGEQPLYPGGE